MKKTFYILSTLLILSAICLTACNNSVEHAEHSFGPWQTKTPATCTAEGVEIRSCECGETEERPISLIDHSWQDATCTSPKTCSACKTTEGMAKGHSIIEATCYSPASCEVCNETLGDPVNHSYSYNAKCVYCGEYAPVGNYKFVSNGDGTCSLTAGGSYNVNAVIPGIAPNGDIVTKIDGAFSGSSSLVSVIIPDTVTEIGYKAFVNCSSLVSVSIPSSVTKIGYAAFNGCKSLESIEIPDSVESIGEAAFGNCIAFKSFTIPNGVKTIGKYAFSNCYDLKGVTVGSGVESIGEYAFQDCDITEIYISDLTAWCKIDFKTNHSNPSASNDYQDELINLYLNGEPLTELVIPEEITKINNFSFYKISRIKTLVIHDGVTEIGERAFTGCEKIESIKIGSGVETIGTYSFNYCISLTDLTLSEGITTIGFGAFFKCENLKAVDIPDSVKLIEDSAFRNCEAMTHLVIGRGVESIEAGAFNNTYLLTDIWYTGSAEEWAEITIGNDLGYITNREIHFDYVRES